MIDNLRKKYKVEKNNVENAYEYQLALKENKEYEQMVDNTFLQIATFFVKQHPNVKIAPPQGREKSKRSLRKKVENLEIERLCKLYSIEGLSKEDELELFSMILKRTRGKFKNEIKTIAIKEIKDLKPIDQIVKNEEIEEKIKTALLRIVKTRIERESFFNKEKLLEELENKYGQTAAKNTNQLANNLLHWESIEKCKQNEESIKKLHNPFEYLKVKDLRGFEIIIADYNDLFCTTLANEFAIELINNEELLENLNIQIVQDGYKHKEKQNGYLAEHIKMCYRDYPEYTFELQIRSIYREDLTRANGRAAHDKRSGKKRIFPNIKEREDFIEQLEDILPNYRVLKRDENGFKLHKCTMSQNMLEYYLGFAQIDDKEYKKAMQFIDEEENRKQEKTIGG